MLRRLGPLCNQVREPGSKVFSTVDPGLEDFHYFQLDRAAAVRTKYFFICERAFTVRAADARGSVQLRGDCEKGGSSKQLRLLHQKPQALVPLSARFYRGEDVGYFYGPH